MTQTLVLKVQGMSCGHCVKAVDEALRSVPGVQSAEVSVGSANVVADDSVQREALVAALDEAGYDVAD